VSEQDDTTQYAVVINHEEQYSIWPTNLTCPPGWTEVGVAGDKQTCLDYIDRTWTDMRPLSLRRHMAAERESVPS
jgi:MbtH protein